MAIRKMKTQRTDARLQLESDEAVELPPAEVEESAVVLQFDSLREFVPELLETLRAGTTAELVPVMRAVYDDTGGIGKLYARQDEIGTPFCLTVDHQSLEDEAVTVRDRDTWEQERVKVSDLQEHLRARLGLGTQS